MVYLKKEDIPAIMGFILSMIILFGGDADMGSSGLWAMAVAIVTLTGTLIAHLLQFKKDSNTIGKVKEDTATMIPEVKSIDENTKRIREQVLEQMSPNLNQLMDTKKDVSILVDELNYQKRLKQETTPYIDNMDMLLAGIKNVYEVNARLTTELKQEKEKASMLLLENIQLKHDLDSYKEYDKNREEGIEI